MAKDKKAEPVVEQGTMIHPRFQYNVPDVVQIEFMQVLREDFSDLYRLIELNAPPGRYRSLSLTALEEAALWANKSITHQEQEDPAKKQRVKVVQPDPEELRRQIEDVIKPTFDGIKAQMHKLEEKVSQFS